jgi:hypothetical protein
MDVNRLAALLTPIGKAGDIALTFGGVGDPLLHPQWADAIRIAKDAGAWGIAIETDLHVQQSTLEQLLTLADDGLLDVISVRLNADSEATYEKLMGRPGFTEVLKRIEWLLNNRRDGLPWIAPRMIKTIDNVHELEPFVDRWTYFCGQAIVEGPGGPIADRAVIDMAPPRRMPCRQLAHRMTILSDGRAALCDQDDDGEQAIDIDNLTSAWRQLSAVHAAHQRQQFDVNPLCAACRQWHRP